jgi:hypothetical protein
LRRGRYAWIRRDVSGPRIGHHAQQRAVGEFGQKKFSDVVALTVQWCADERRQLESDERLDGVLGDERRQLGEIRVQFGRIDEHVVVQSLRCSRADNRVSW